ncbi:MAG: HAD family phosphatase [Rubrobacteraceae bacterium]|nr:HAD family phosphatase [Rubrobacteraceae bacterium]
MRSVVFDLGGVLVDWDPRYLYRKLFSDEEEMERFLSEVCSPRWNRQLDLGRPFEEAVAELRARHPRYAREIEAYHSRWGEMLGGPIAGSVELLGRLRGRGVPLYALTNWSSETFAIARKRYGFLGWFEEIVVSGEEKVAKPDHEIYRRLVERCRLDPRSTLFVDDVEENVAAARSLGFYGVVFRDPEMLAEELARLGILESGVRAGG